MFKHRGGATCASNKHPHSVTHPQVAEKYEQIADMAFMPFMPAMIRVHLAEAYRMYTQTLTAPTHPPTGGGEL